MKWISDPIHQISVSLWTDKGPFLLGLLSYHVQKKTSSFSWSKEAIESGEQWSPFFCPVQSQIYKSKDLPLPIDFHGLPGFLNDALPDGWGLLVMDKALKKLQVPPSCITPALRLALLEDRAWGGLIFEPTLQSGLPLDHKVNLNSLSQEVFSMRDGVLDVVSNDLLVSAGSPHGARPKLFLSLSEDFKKATTSLHPNLPGFSPWIIKFAAKEEHIDAPKGEYVYMQLAKMAGLSVTDHTLLCIGGESAFAAKRFDNDGTKRHYVHTMGGMLHVSHRDNSADYTNLAEILHKLPKGEQSLEEGFRRVCFNALFSVRDDHVKNISFIKKNHGWALTPAYDLTYMEGPNGYHSMMFAQGSSQDPTISDLLRCATSFGIEHNKALSMLKNMAEISQSFPLLAKNLDIDKRWIKMVGDKIGMMGKRLTPKNAPAIRKSKNI